LKQRIALLSIPLLAVLSLIPLFGPGDFILRILISVFMFAALAESWNIISGFTGYFSFGQVAFFGIGAYTMALLLRWFNLSPFIIIAAAVVISAGFAFVLGIITLRLRGAYFTLSTLVSTLALKVIVDNTPDLTGGAKGISLPLPGIDIHVFTTVVYYAQFLFLVASVYFVHRIVNSRFGLGLKGIREDEEVAEVMGVDTAKYKAFAYVLSAIFPAMIGAVWSLDRSYIFPFTAFDTNLEVVTIAIAVFGGTGTITGPLWGSFILILFREMLRIMISGAGSAYLLIFGLVLILVIIFVPEGVSKKLNGAIRKVLK
jgi:branched-chain amino acid transport system permease protein